MYGESAARFHVSALNGSGNYVCRSAAARYREHVEVPRASIVAAAAIAVLAVLEVSARTRSPAFRSWRPRASKEYVKSSRTHDLLVAMAWIVGIAGNGEARERDAGMAVGHAFGACQCFDHSVSSSFANPKWLYPALTSFTHPVAEHLCQLAEVFLVALVVRARLRWMAVARRQGRTAPSSCAGTPCPSRASAGTADSRHERRPSFRVLVPVSSTLNVGYGVFQMLVCGARSYSKFPK